VILKICMQPFQDLAQTSQLQKTVRQSAIFASCIFELLDGDEFRMSVTTSGIDAVAVELVTKGVDDALF